MERMRTKRPSIPTSMEGLLPPQEIELEEAILGALMLESNSYEAISDLLKPECFYKDSHGTIFKAISQLYDSKQPIDILTVTAEIRKLGKLDEVGGAFYITQLTSNVVGSANILHHARIVVEAFLAREIIRISGEYQRKAFDPMEDVFELMDAFNKDLEQIVNYGTDQADEIPLGVAVDQRVKEKEKMVREGVTFTGIPTGSDKLDKITGGWVKQNLVIIAARPAMGKSVKAMQYSKVAAQNGHGVLFFSLEMSTQELIDRFIVEDQEILLHEYRANKLTDYDLVKIRNAGNNLKKLPIIFDDTPAINCKYILRKAKRAKKGNFPLGLIVVDYLQLMSGDDKNKNREQEISQISRGLKNIAKELDIPVISLAQVGRSAELNKDKRPELSHLREGGSIENDADVVGFIYRPSYYFEHGQHPDNEYSQDSISQTDYNFVSELIIAKNRNGIPNAKIKEKFYGAYSKFTDKEIEVVDPFNTPIDNSDIKPLPFTDAPF